MSPPRPAPVLAIAGGTRMAGGVESNLLLLLQHWDHAMIAPLVVTPGEGPLTDHVRTLDTPCTTVPYYAWRLPNPFRHLETLARLVQVTRQHRTQVIYLNHHCMLEFAAKLAVLTRLPLVCHMRGIEDAPYMESNRKWLRIAAVVIATSQAVRENLVRWGVEEHRIRLIYDAIDPTPFTDSTLTSCLRRDYGFSANTPLIGTVSRIRIDKGISDFIHAAALVAAERPDVRFLVVGTDEDGGQSMQRFRAQADSLGLGERLVFTGFCEDLPSVLRDFNVFVLASWMEACPISIMEAMAAGTLVVATAVGGIPEIIDDRVHGLLCPARDPRALGKRILGALSMNERDRNSIQARALARVRERFYVAVQARAIEDTLTSVTVDGEWFWRLR